MSLPLPHLFLPVLLLPPTSRTPSVTFARAAHPHASSSHRVASSPFAGPAVCAAFHVRLDESVSDAAFAPLQKHPIDQMWIGYSPGAVYTSHLVHISVRDDDLAAMHSLLTSLFAIPDVLSCCIVDKERMSRLCRECGSSAHNHKRCPINSMQATSASTIAHLTAVFAQRHSQAAAERGRSAAIVAAASPHIAASSPVIDASSPIAAATSPHRAPGGSPRRRARARARARVGLAPVRSVRAFMLP